ncbi:TPA: restriction endonuclease subunit S [Acinetobacter baumannii]|uniref:restriction endonuclease subunit S n=1 Tax=Acinetobacter towneri TaxID=202956 RepID=UPI002935168E|nr:restriction endonuclease subunit S [Acinetobacter towneri]WOE29243.1 restriction endonuclease subunit S [Acinetobacter towneri]HAV4464351.1 restriction endonuclease subunit S [Acinetobacter baumannii]
MSFNTLLLEDAGIQLIDGDRGKNYPTQSHFSNKGFCLFLSAKNVTNNGFEFSDLVFIDKNRDELLRAGKLQRGDIVVTTRGTIGNVALYSDTVPFEHIRINSGMIIFRADENIWNRNFLYFLLSSEHIKKQINSLTSGSAVPQLPARDIKKFELPKIPKKIQDRIDKIIGDLHFKIHINNQINQTLESIAQSIFKSWFIDFDPVRAKIAAKQEGKDTELAAMCAISGKSEVEIQQMSDDDFIELQATAALFPDELVESELGEVPKGWDAITLGNFLEIKRGGSPRPIQNFMAPTGYPWVKIADATADPSPFLFKTKEFIIKEGLRKTVYLKKGSLILTNSATPGLPKFLELDACIHDGWLYFPQKKHFSDNYLYFLFLKLRTQLVAQGNGSVFTNLKTDILRNQVVLVPTKEVIEKFDFQVGKILEMMKTQCIQSSNLSDLRDTLLPKLLSGKVSVLGFQGEVA